MRIIDKANWARREHFRLYNGLEFPHVNICVQMDVTELWTHRANLDASPTVALVYAITRAANRLPELRQRIRGEEVVEHDVVHPQVTVLGDDDLFGVVVLTYDDDFSTFAPRATEVLSRAKENASLAEFHLDHQGQVARDDLLSITILPWLAFTSFALARKPQTDAVPILAIGKVQAAGDRYQLPFSLNFHHALADGLHVARFVRYAEEEAQALVAQS